MTKMAIDVRKWIFRKSEGFFKDAYSVTFDIFRFFFYLKSFVKVELSYVFTINLFTIAKNCTEK